MSDFDRFIHRHYASLCAIALRFVGSDEVAKDIAQDVIVKYYETLRTENDPSDNINNLLFTMVKNRALNHLRSDKRRLNRHSSAPKEIEQLPEVTNILIEEQLNQLLIDAIKTLPLQSEKIMRMVLSGMTNDEIAKVQGVSVNTIKTLKYSSLRKLREYLYQKGYTNWTEI